MAIQSCRGYPCDIFYCFLVQKGCRFFSLFWISIPFSMTIFLNFFWVKRGKAVEETLFLLDILCIFHYNKAVDLLFQLFMFWFFESCRGNLDIFISRGCLHIIERGRSDPFYVLAVLLTLMAFDTLHCKLKMNNKIYKCFSLNSNINTNEIN